MPEKDANAEFIQKLAVHIGGFTARRPEAYWLWHPIPNDAFLLAAQRERPDLLSSAVAGLEEDEAVAVEVEGLAADHDPFA